MAKPKAKQKVSKAKLNPEDEWHALCLEVIDLHDCLTLSVILVDVNARRTTSSLRRLTRCS